jgi:hypothetical protein
VQVSYEFAQYRISHRPFLHRRKAYISVTHHNKHFCPSQKQYFFSPTFSSKNFNKVPLVFQITRGMPGMLRSNFQSKSTKTKCPCLLLIRYNKNTIQSSKSHKKYNKKCFSKLTSQGMPCTPPLTMSRPHSTHTRPPLAPLASPLPHLPNTAFPRRDSTLSAFFAHQAPETREGGSSSTLLFMTKRMLLPPSILPRYPTFLSSNNNNRSSNRSSSSRSSRGNKCPDRSHRRSDGRDAKVPRGM